jgi:hypothetical protein
MFSMKRLVAVGVTVGTITAYSILPPCSAKADDERGDFGDVTITQVSATPARAGETTIVTFSVENSGSDRTLITGLRLPRGEASRVMGAFGQGHSGEIGVLSIPPGGSERLDRGKVWIEVGPLAHDLTPDTAVPARLVLGSYEIPLTLHVGPVATGSTQSSTPGSTTVVKPSPVSKQIGARC